MVFRKFLTIMAAATAISAAACVSAMAAEVDPTPTPTPVPALTISDEAGLKAFAEDVNNGTNNYSGKYVVLDEDINLDGNEWTPIGTSENPFRGTFDGCNHTISNYQVNGTNYLGLFGYVRGTMLNLNVADVTINGKESLGGIAGSLINGNITSCGAENVTINGTHWAGGIVGYTYTNFTKCHVKDITIVLINDAGSDPSTSVGDKAGGIAGILCEGKFSMEDCTAENVDITAVRDAGGLVGVTSGTRNSEANTMTFTNCSVTGNVHIETNGRTVGFPSLGLGSAPAAGGIVGRTIAYTHFNGCTPPPAESVVSLHSEYAGQYFGFRENTVFVNDETITALHY